VKIRKIGFTTNGFVEDDRVIDLKYLDSNLHENLKICQVM